MDDINDRLYLKETLRLARKGMGWTNPNPMVGALIVKNGKVIGKGYHKRVGFPHAEIEALQNTKTDVKGSTLYLNLEACSHYGRTPPCVDAIIKSGIRRVVCSTPDSNPKVHGQGMVILRKAGIEVLVGLLETEARVLNEAFFTFHEKKRPFIGIKFAASLDGKIATRTGDSKWITNAKARSFARNLRSQYQAVLVGINTVLADDPHLGVRRKGKKDPLRIVLDSTLKIPLTSQVLRDANVLIATTIEANKEKKVLLKRRGISFLTFRDKTIPVHNLLTELQKKDIISILVEGGSQVLGSFVDARLIDKVYAFHAPILINGHQAISAIQGKGINKVADATRLKNTSYRKFDDNLLTTAYADTNFS